MLFDLMRSSGRVPQCKTTFHIVEYITAKDPYKTLLTLVPNSLSLHLEIDLSLDRNKALQADGEVCDMFSSSKNDLNNA